MNQISNPQFEIGEEVVINLNKGEDHFGIVRKNNTSTVEVEMEGHVLCLKKYKVSKRRS